jgi:hypothetical protein
MAMTQQEKSDLKALRKRVKELGCVMTLEKHGDSVRLGVEAPKGYHFVPELHEYVDWSYQPWQPDFADMLDRLSTGIEICEDAECEWCYPD